MGIKTNRITVHKCVFREQARKVKQVINSLSKKDCLSACDTQAIRELTIIYGDLFTLALKKDDLYPAINNNDPHEVCQ